MRNIFIKCEIILSMKNVLLNNSTIVYNGTNMESKRQLVPVNSQFLVSWVRLFIKFPPYLLIFHDEIENTLHSRFQKESVRTI